MKVPYIDFPAQFEGTRAATLQAIERVFERGDFILGSEVQLFEKEFADLCGVRHAISVANGTDALVMALKVLGIGPGDEVITASNSWVSSASSAALLGATPVFADVGPDQNISPEMIESRITSKTKAIMPVHLAGKCAQMGAILKLAESKKIPVIEDAAQSVGSKTEGRVAGSFGIMGCFSLHPLKNLNAAGDAGMITTDSDDLALKLKLLRNHGLKNREEIVTWGFNSRLDTVQAAILRVRLPLLPRIITRRREIASIYTREFAPLFEKMQLPTESASDYHTYHVFAIQCDRRDDLKTFLEKRGIDTKIHYPIPIHLQDAAAYLGYKPGSLPVTERQAKRILSLPIHSHLSDEQVAWVCESVREFYETQ